MRSDFRREPTTLSRLQITFSLFDPTVSSSVELLTLLVSCAKSALGVAIDIAMAENAAANFILRSSKLQYLDITTFQKTLIGLPEQRRLGLEPGETVGRKQMTTNDRAAWKLSAARVGVAAVALALTLVSVPANAQDSEADNPYLQSLRACQAETDSSARLVCFDRAANEILSAEAAGDLRVVDREAVRKTRRGLFGFSLPDLGIFGKGDGEKEEEINEIETTIAAVSGTYGTGYTIRTAEGAVWRISDVPRRLLEPKAGDKLTIKSGALSAYYLRIGDQSGVKGSRVR